MAKPRVDPEQPLVEPAQPTSSGEPVFGRTPMQKRSKARREKITSAVIQLLGEGGEARLTHRDVAKTAGVSLAATTYYYGSKLDLLTDASQAILRSYVSNFRAFVERRRAPHSAPLTFAEATRRIIFNGVVRERPDTIAYCEITAGCGRNPETRALSREWYRNLLELWNELAALLRGPKSSIEVQSVIDQVIGILYLGVPLGFSADDLDRALDGDLLAALPQHGLRSAPAISQDAQSDTRQRIISTAIALMARSGAGAVTGRAVATEAGVAPAVPAYHFKPITKLLEAARNHLYEGERARFGELMRFANATALDLNDLVDLLTAILIREVTQFREVNLASLSIDVEAARESALRPVVALRRESEEKAWDKVLELSGIRRRSSDALVVMSLFYGMKVRLLATGCEVSDMAGIRKELVAAFTALRDRRTWI